MAKTTRKELEEKLSELGKKLLSPPSDPVELLSILDQTDCCLSRVGQSPTHSMYKAFRPAMEALVSEQLLNLSEVDLKVAVTSCLTEITRITAPLAPYSDDLMKVIFQMTVDTFEKLDDICSQQYSKRLSILDTVANLRSAIIMLDLECDALVLEMFKHLFKAIRPDHTARIFSAMEDIMTTVLEESEDISQDLLFCLLESVKNDNKDILPIARRLGEKVISNSAVRIKPYLLRVVQSIGSLNDYSSTVALVLEGNSNERVRNEINASSEGLESEKPGAKGICSEETSIAAAKLPELVMGYGTVLTGNGNFVVEPNSPEQKLERSSRSIEPKSPALASRTESDILCYSTFQKLGSLPDHTIKKTVACQEGNCVTLPDTSNIIQTDSKKEVSTPPSWRHHGSQECYGVRSDSEKELKENADCCQTPAGGVSSVKGMSGSNNLKVQSFEQTGIKGLARNIIQRESPAKKKNTKSKQQKGKIDVKASADNKLTLEDDPSSASSLKAAKEVHNLDESSKAKSRRKRVRKTELIYGEQTQENRADQNLVNCRILVWWPDDKMFYGGTVEWYDQNTKKHKILYDDGDVEVLSLKGEIWKLCGDYNVASWQGQANYNPNFNTPPEKRAEAVNLKSTCDSASNSIREAEITAIKSGEEIQGKTNTILPQKRPFIEDMVDGKIGEPKTAWGTENDLKKVKASESSVSVSLEKESSSKEEMTACMCISNLPVLQDQLPTSALKQAGQPAGNQEETADFQEELVDVSSTIPDVSNILENSTEEQHPKEDAASKQFSLNDEDIEDLKAIEAEKQLRRKNRKRQESVTTVAVNPLPPKISSHDEVDVDFPEHIFYSDFLKKIRVFSKIIQNRWYQINLEPLTNYVELADEFGRTAAFDHGNLFSTIRQSPHYQGFGESEHGVLEDLWYELPLVFEGLHKSFVNKMYFRKNAETIKGWIENLKRAGFDISVPLAAFELLTVSPTTFKKFRESLQSVSIQLTEEEENLEALKSELPVSIRVSEIDSTIGALKKQIQDLESERKSLEPLRVVELELEKYGTSLKACRLQKLKQLYEKEIADAENFIREVSLDSFFNHMNQLE